MIQSYNVITLTNLTIDYVLYIMTLVYYILHTQSAVLAFEFIPYSLNFVKITTI